MMKNVKTVNFNGERLFDENYEPEEKDYAKEEWAGFLKDQKTAIKRNVKNGWFKTEKEALKDCPISAVIPYNKRGLKPITTIMEAKKSIKNIRSYLS